MNISKLEVKNYKGYKDIATVLDENVRTGKSKMYQLKEWKRHFDWLEHGRYDWQVTSIHNEIKEKIDGRINNKGGNNKKYADDIDDLILFILYMHHQVNVTLTYFKEELKLISSSYYDDFAFNARSVAESFNGYPVWYAYDFFVNTRQMANSMLKKSFARLQNRNLIDIVVRSYIQDTDYLYHEATAEEIEKIKSIKKNLLSSMGFKNENSCIKSGKYDLYRNKLENLLLDINVNMFFDKYEITQIMGMDFVEAVCIFDLDHYNRMISSLNNDICENIIINAQNRKNKSIEKINKSRYEFIHDYSKGDEWKASNKYDYVSFYKEMVDRYIRIQI